ncbi:MAG: alpha/beta fold hydrolase [Solirubrobacterales bacterium]|jgi:pimeloyl-ACP methyl ester carboxylesterase|nr:alpha/beta fold hydrolase [Solirubrobacterales bacterium]
MRLRLFHHRDGARVAYREAGTGPGLVLVHSALMTHREFEPVVEHLSDRYRVILPDLPLHGDSEDRPRHPYTLDWFAEVMAAFCRETAGPQPLVGGHGLGAEVLLRAVETGRLRPGSLVLMPNRLHRPAQGRRSRAAWRVVARAAGVPGLDRAFSHAARVAFRPERGVRLTARGVPEARDLVRHAFADVGGNAKLARSWSLFARRFPTDARRELLDAYPRIGTRVLLLWADEDRLHPLLGAEEALDLLPDAQLRILPGTGYLIAYDDPVGVARELAAFCG